MRMVGAIAAAGLLAISLSSPANAASASKPRPAGGFALATDRAPQPEPPKPEKERHAPPNPVGLRHTCGLYFNYTPGQAMDRTRGHWIRVVKPKNKRKTVNYRYHWNDRWSVVQAHWGAKNAWGFMSRWCLGKIKHDPGPHHEEVRGTPRTRWYCGQSPLDVRDHEMRFVGALYHGERFVQYGPPRAMKREKGNYLSIGKALGHANKNGRVYTRYLSEKPCDEKTTTKPSTVQPPQVTPPSPQSATCHWKVTWPSAGVYEDPARDHGLLKSKRSGEVVGPYCNTHHNAAENETYIMVRTESAADGIGWMRRGALTHNQ